MSCERYRAGLMDAALGAPPAPDLQEHLASCPGCRAAFDEQRRLLGRIDTEMGSALAVTPSPEFLARVELRVAERANRRPLWLMGWVAAAAMVAGVLVVSAHFMRGKAVESPSPPRQAAVETPRPAPRVEPLPPSASASAPAPAPAAQPPPARRAEPEVLLPPGQDALVRRFAENVRDRRVDAESLLAVGLDSGETPDITVPAVEIKPLKIEPIKGSE